MEEEEDSRQGKEGRGGGGEGLTKRKRVDEEERG